MPHPYPYHRIMQLQLQVLVQLLMFLLLVNVTVSAANTNSFVVGNNNTVVGEDSILVTGNENIVRGNRSTIVGNNNIIINGTDDSIAGGSNQVQGYGNTIIGNSNQVQGDSNLLTGNSNSIIGSNLNLLGNSKISGTPTIDAATYNNTTHVNLTNASTNLISSGKQVTFRIYANTSNTTCTTNQQSQASIIYQGISQCFAYPSVNVSTDKSRMNISDIHHYGYGYWYLAVCSDSTASSTWYIDIHNSTSCNSSTLVDTVHGSAGNSTCHSSSVLDTMVNESVSFRVDCTGESNHTDNGYCVKGQYNTACTGSQCIVTGASNTTETPEIGCPRN